jgi:hypothetical protein
VAKHLSEEDATVVGLDLAGHVACPATTPVTGG